VAAKGDPQARGRTDIAVVSADNLPVEVPPSGAVVSASSFPLPPLPGKSPRRRFGGLLTLSALLVIGLPTLLAVWYYGFRASNQYVTTFQFAVRGPTATTAHASGALSGGTAMTPDAFVVTDYINSQQAILDVERVVDLRSMFSKPTIDFWARLPENSATEGLKDYWSRVVFANFDLVSGNVSVSVKAFTPQESLNLAQALIKTSNEMFRRLNEQGQRDFVHVADESVQRAERDLADARQKLMQFRERSGLVDPDKTALAGAAIVDDLRKQLVAVQTQYTALRSTSPNSPSLDSLKSQIAALERQVEAKDNNGQSAARAVTPETLRQFQSVDLERQFAEKQYTEMLSLRSQAYMMAQNQQSFLALFVQPTLAQTALYPERLKSIATVLVAAAALWFAGMLITYAVRDHMI
jgi:capsular polysaccharide transport system permease protein